MPSSSSYQFQLQGQSIQPQNSTSQVVAAACGIGSVVGGNGGGGHSSNDAKQNIMLAAKKKQIEIHNKLLFPTINKENSNTQGSGTTAQPRVKIADLSHNLLGYENGNPIVNNGNDSVGSLRIVDQSTGGGVGIRKKNN